MFKCWQGERPLQLIQECFGRPAHNICQAGKFSSLTIHLLMEVLQRGSAGKQIRSKGDPRELIGNVGYIAEVHELFDLKWKMQFPRIAVLTVGHVRGVANQECLVHQIAAHAVIVTIVDEPPAKSSHILRERLQQLIIPLLSKYLAANLTGPFFARKGQASILDNHRRISLEINSFSCLKRSIC